MSLIAKRSFCSTLAKLLTIGKTPINIPNNVEFDTINQPLNPKLKSLANSKTLVIKGPKGSTKMSLHNFVKLNFNNSVLDIQVQDSSIKHQREMWSTTRTLINNNVVGVTDGHHSILKLSGVGYRASLAGGKIDLKVGYSHPVLIEIPDDLKVEIPNQDTIVIMGCDLQRVKLFAHKIRSFRKPEPYKLKGIFVDGETIKKKEVKKK